MRIGFDMDGVFADMEAELLRQATLIFGESMKRRLEERLTDETKNWKFRAGDLDDRALWKEYTAAYHDALRHCSKRHAPWYIVPADDKAVRNLLVARTIADTLDGLGLRYPPASAEVRALEIK